MFFENDRTFCVDEKCKHTECYRHQANVVGKPRFISMADFNGTKECAKECTKCKHILRCEGAMCGTPCYRYEEEVK